MTELPRLTELLALTAEQRLALAEALWASLAAEPERLPVPEWHRTLLDERLPEDDLDDGPGETWAELRQRIEKGA